MVINPYCDFCKDELKEPVALLFSPPGKDSTTRKYHLCQKRFKLILRVMRKGITEIEDILSFGPAWLNYTRKIKRKRK